MKANPARITALCTLVAVVATVVELVADVRGTPPTHAAVARSRVTGGAASMDELLARFLGALRAKDRGALESLRFTEDEYRRVILPGFVEKGEKPKNLSEDASKYFYGTMNTKSLYHREGILKRHGGKEYTLKEFRFAKGTKELATFTAYRRLMLTLVDEAGNEVELQTGSIAEVDGRFKFASFIRD